MTTPFSQLPEWILDSEVSDRAVRLYCVLGRYGNGKASERYPSRSLLAKRCHCSVGSVDRALQELVDMGALKVTHTYKGQRQQTSHYALLTTRPIAGGSSRVMRRVITGDEGGSSRVMNNRKKITDNTSIESPCSLTSEQDAKSRHSGQKAEFDYFFSINLKGSLDPKAPIPLFAAFPQDSPAFRNIKRVMWEFICGARVQALGKSHWDEWFAAAQELGRLAQTEKSPELAVFRAASRMRDAWDDRKYRTPAALTKQWTRFGDSARGCSAREFEQRASGTWYRHASDWAGV